MSEPYTDILEDESDDAGIHRRTLATAVSCWSFMQNREKVSVAEAATAFNATPGLILRAIEDHYWMYLECAEGETDPTKQFIGHDGE